MYIIYYISYIIYHLSYIVYYIYYITYIILYICLILFDIMYCIIYIYIVYCIIYIYYYISYNIWQLLNCFFVSECWVNGKTPAACPSNQHLQPCFHRSCGCFPLWLQPLEPLAKLPTAPCSKQLIPQCPSPWRRRLTPPTRWISASETPGVASISRPCMASPVRGARCFTDVLRWAVTKIFVDGRLTMVNHQMIIR